MPFLDRGDCRIYYETAGSGAAILFLHGLGGSHISWWQQVAHFSPRYCCITFAHRGFPPSTTPNGGVDPDRFAGDLEAIIDLLDLEDVRLVAQSMGGVAAIEYTVRFPHRVVALVLSGTLGPLAHPDLQRALAAGRAQLAERRDEARAAGFNLAAGARLAREQPALDVLYRGIDAMSSHLDKATLRDALAVPSIPTGDLNRTGVPMLWIFGGEDPQVMPGIATPDAVRLVMSEFPGSRIEVVPDAGHSVYFERASVFNALLDDFLLALPKRR
ncbi:MAG TPA: alpha/beta hydrolase [Candidatus Micrarchaeaceae archaeon]|nr:alpha/beta hydrolase [Candidatus Micrarchaeaceae archaeon]